MLMSERRSYSKLSIRRFGTKEKRLSADRPFGNCTLRDACELQKLTVRQNRNSEGVDPVFEQVSVAHVAKNPVRVDQAVPRVL